MTTTKNLNGSYTLSDIIDGHLIAQTYYFYTLKECKELFNQYVKEIESHENKRTKRAVTRPTTSIF